MPPCVHCAVATGGGGQIGRHPAHSASVCYQQALPAVFLWRYICDWCGVNVRVLSNTRITALVMYKCLTVAGASPVSNHFGGNFVFIANGLTAARTAPGAALTAQ